MKKILLTFITVLLLFGLTACGESTEEKILGDWQLIEGGEESDYWEIKEDKLKITSNSDDYTENMEYIITEIEDDEFRFEVFEPINNTRMVLFEGYFENKNTIKSIRYEAGDFELIRLKEDETKEVVSKKEDEKNKLYSMVSMEYSIPESWTEEVSDENLKNYYPEDGMLVVSYDELDGTVSNDDLRTEFIEGFTSSFDSFDIISESEITVAGTTAYQYNLNNVLSNDDYKTSLVIFDYSDGIMALTMTTLSDSDKDYSNEFESILSSIEFPDETTETEVDETTETEVSETYLDNGDYVYDIKEIEQIKGKYDDDILTIELEFTNNTDKPHSPWMSLAIAAYQETENTVEILSGANGQYPDDYKPELVDMGGTNVKPGKTVDAVIGYTIKYPGSDVLLQDFGDKGFFENVVETKE